MKRALENPQAENFHAWRKEIKALWYALRLVAESSATVQRDVQALQRADTWLGDDHNVVVLCEELSRDTTVCAGPIDVDRLRLVADREQCRLRDKAIARARKVYRRRSTVYARAIADAWKRLSA